MNAEFKIKVRWELRAPDLDVTCRKCGDPVYGPFRQLSVQIESLEEAAVPEWRLCLSCYGLI